MTADALTRTAPLHHESGQFAQLPDGVQVLPESFVAQASLRIDAGASAAVAAHLGVALPTTPNTWVQGELATVVWLGPDEWLVLSPFVAPRDLDAGLRAAVGSGNGAVVDVSAQRTTLRLRGAHARDVLASGCAIDLHPGVFPAGSAVQTTLGRTGILLLGLGENDFRLLVRSSFARYLAAWLIDAAQEYRIQEYRP
ncbi:sarcosine oxidase subunit gamma [Pseudonocardia sp. GCM10023141]|uniref:sarcosine oxidase subunit gamma n=1 Tax=Pseudonocardia sp. GCM10023141 TaxID=3252653 RepID=UPI00360F0632